MDRFQANCYFSSLEEDRELVENLRKTGSLVRVDSFCIVERHNRLTQQLMIDSKSEYSSIRFVGDKHNAGDNRCSLFSFEINYSHQHHALQFSNKDLGPMGQNYEAITSRQLDNGQFENNGSIVKIIRSTTGHIEAIYRQSVAQQQLYQSYGDVLIVNLYFSSNSPHNKKTLLAISVVDEDGTGFTVCLVMLLGRITLNLITHCLKIFVSFNDPSIVSSVIVGREDLLTCVHKIFRKADHVLSQDRMLQLVSNELSTHSLDTSTREKLCNAFLVCCSTSSEQEFGLAESLLLSAGGVTGAYFENRWFQQTDIWRAIDRLHQRKKSNNIKSVTITLYRKLVQTGFFQ